MSPYLRSRQQKLDCLDIAAGAKERKGSSPFVQYANACI